VKAGARRVLVVDDDVDMLRVVRDTLTTMAGCVVDTTPNAEYAFELLLKKPYDLLIADFAMPAVDGATLYALLGKVYAITPPRGQTLPPLLLMSGNAAQRRAQDLLREPGVRGLVAKPFSLEKLVEKVSMVLGPAKASAA
jgi:CheY-like chemotaxis protein